MATTVAVENRTKTSDPLSKSTMDALRQRQVKWAQQPIKERLKLIRTLRQTLPLMQSEFCKALQTDLHKPHAETVVAELLPVAGACRFLEQRAKSILRSRKVSFFDTPSWLLGENDIVTRKPRGIVGIIGTWNYPMFLNGVQIVQALAAGNVVIWKPSEIAPQTAEVMTAWLRRAGIGDDLVHVLPAEREWGAKLAEADIDYIVFTGHDATGKKLAARLGERLIPSTMELSGHDAMLILNDANLDLASKAVHFGATVNCGQTCVAPRRIFVPRQLLSSLQEKVQAHFTKPAEHRPLAMPAHQAQVNRMVAAACEEGAKVLIPSDGKPTEQGGLPVVLTEVRPGMNISKEALFAPVTMLIPYEEQSEALDGIRQSDYGLALSIFTADREAAKRLAAELPAGLVTINDVVAPVAHPATPFGGIGRSGWGITQGKEGLLELTIPQVISYRSGNWRPHFDPAGSTPVTDEGVVSGMLRWEHSPTFWERTKGFFGMLGSMRRAMKKK